MAELPRVWWRGRRIRVLTLAVIPLSLIDAYYTQLYISKFGVEGEANPIVRHMFEAGLGVYWPLLNTTASFVLTALLASSILLLYGDLQTIARAVFSAMMGVRTAMDTYYIIHDLRLIELRWSIVAVGVLAFVVCENAIKPWLNIGSLIRETLHLFGEISPSRSLAALVGSIQVRLGVFSNLPRSQRGQGFTTMSGRLKDRRLLKPILILVLSPLALFIFLQLSQNLVSETVPSYLRSLGTVTEIQGQLFLISLAVIILVLILVMYAVTSIFTILTRGKAEE